MRITIILAFIYFLFTSCEKKKNKTDLNDNLYNVLINYQKKNPFKETPENSIYVYEVYFYQDSTLSVTLSPIGVNREEKNLYGIYKDETLKATYIIDNSRIGKNFVKKYFQKDLEKFTQKDFVINDAIYQEYIYQINGKNLILKDSVRGNVHR
ncbi:hypothetical protein SAMN05421856_102434 [Chryseobacterium taichungense]|uniref:Uncharacterized protein n=1 Tax=Chryseobacterium taichungense TaxID=295069 RepID=A0A1H7XH86_9FLAO|nr:hypothetical protein [Chryseobacterium taichungense]SEM32974.1 hypothetical protein SAMN05421856_102434 [Chryseobacterium taichungense]